MASVYPGYTGERSLVQVVVGTCYALVDGGIAGGVLAWLYNRLPRPGGGGRRPPGGGRAAPAGRHPRGADPRRASAPRSSAAGGSGPRARAAAAASSCARLEQPTRTVDTASPAAAKRSAASTPLAAWPSRTRTSSRRARATSVAAP